MESSKMSINYDLSKTELKKRNWVGLLYISPWLLGFVILQVYPFFSSLYYSFTDFSLFKTPVFIGIKNFYYMFALYSIFYQSL